MALNSGKILMRRGQEVNFDPNKMIPGEWAVSLDSKYVRMCFSPGVCVRMATYDAFEADMVQIQRILEECQTIEEAVNRINDEISVKSQAVAEYTAQAKQYRDEAEQFRNEAFSSTPEGYLDLVEQVEENTRKIAEGVGGVSSYNDLENKPTINDVELNGNKTLDELGIASKEALEETDNKVNIIIEQAELRFKENASGENIHLDDSADSKLVEFALYGKARQNTTTGKNLLPYPFYETTKTASGIAFTDNGDGTITANGTATATVNFIFNHRIDGKMLLEAGEYIVSGCPKNGSDSTYRLLVAKTSTSGSFEHIVREYGNGASFTLTEKTDIFVGYEVINGATVSNLVVRPMIRLASITDATYEPYTGGIPSPRPDCPQDIEVAGESYNLIPYPYEITTKTVNGITWTDLGDGRIMANGTATETSSFDNFLGNQTEGLREKLQSYGEVVLTGCPSGGGSSTYRLFVWGAYNDGGYSANDYGSGATFTFDNNDKAFGFSAQIIKGVKVENLIFKPMLRKASVKNNRYMPYGKGSVEVKSAGKNLIPYPFYETTKTVDGITTNDNGDGTLSINGTSTSGSAKYRILNLDATIEIPLQSQEYKLTWGDTINPRIDLVLTKIDGTTQALYGTSGSITINNTNGQYIGISNMYVNVANGQTVSNALIKPMLRLATDTDDTWQPYKETLSTIPTPNGLAGIPVESGGNYTDENGQQWICDEIVKYADGSGEYVKRIEKKVFDGLNNVCTWVSSSVNNGTLRQINLGNKASMPNSVFINSKYILCDKFKPFKFNNVNDNFAYGCRQGNTSSICCLLKESDGVTDVASANEWLKKNNVKAYYIINPIRTPLTAEEIAEIEKLSTFYPVTNISNDADCGMKVKYIADAKSYIDNRLALIEQAMLNSI